MALVTCKNSPFKQGVALVMCERIKASNNSFLEFAEYGTVQVYEGDCALVVLLL